MGSSSHSSRLNKVIDMTNHELLDKMLKDEIIEEYRDIDIILPRKGGFNGTPVYVVGDKLFYSPPDEKDLKYLFRWWGRTAFSRVKGGRATYKDIERDKTFKRIFGSKENQSGFSIVLEYNPSSLSQIKKRYEELLEDLKNHFGEHQIRDISRKLGRTSKVTISVKKRGDVGDFLNIRRRDGIIEVYINDRRLRDLIYVLDVSRIRFVSRRSLEIPNVYEEVGREVHPWRDLKRYIFDQLLSTALSMAYVPRKISVDRLYICGRSGLKDSEKEFIKNLSRLALLFGSVGSVSNRGVGSIICSKLDYRFEEEDIRSLIKEVADSVPIDSPYREKVDEPVVPTLDEELRIFRYIYIGKRRSIESLLDIATSSYMANKNIYIKSKRLRYYLGLPRKEFNGKRRESPIKTKIIHKEGVDGGLLTYGFYSKDISERSKDVNKRDFNEAFDKIVDYQKNR